MQIKQNILWNFHTEDKSIIGEVNESDLYKEENNEMGRNHI